jgi:hypothetical protein
VYLIGCGDPLTGRNGRGMSNDRYQLAVPTCLDPENTKPVVIIMEGNALDEAGENFLGWWLLVRLHVDRQVAAWSVNRLDRFVIDLLAANSTRRASTYSCTSKASIHRRRPAGRCSRCWACLPSSSGR